MKTFRFFAALLGAAGVALEAPGAHALRDTLAAAPREGIAKMRPEPQ